MAIKLDMLRCFVAVAECGNLADAGTRLSRSTAAISMTLKQLEDHLQKSLFETDRKSKLSAVGRTTFELAQAELRQFDRAILSIENFAQGGSGIVRIASVPSVAGTVLPKVLERFIAENPKVHIELRDMDSSNVVQAMRQDRIDIGIATVTENLQGAQLSPLVRDRFGLVCSHEHPLGKSSDPMEWTELEGVTFMANELCGMIGASEFQSIYQRANLKVHNIVSLLAMVKANLGVTVLPQTVLKLHPEELVFRPLADSLAVRTIDMLHRPSSIASPAADRLQAIIRETTNGLYERTLNL